jgi:CHAT domain-containing protein/tetratricopeptide (TPR) repeat protein
MGQVWLARQLALGGRPVALKVIHPHQLGEHTRQRFRREKEIAALLEDDHIVRVYDAGEDDGRPFLVLERLEGESLQQLLQRRGRLAVADACEVARQAARGLGVAHRAGVIHRDVKLGNLFLTRGAVVKILDWGLARRLGVEGDLTRPHQGMGSLDFTPPEQWADARKADERSDLFALGVTLYALLTGSKPAAGSPLHLPAEVPAALAVLLRRLLAENPEDRPATAAEVEGALEPFARGHDLRRLAGAAERLQAALDVRWWDDEANRWRSLAETGSLPMKAGTRFRLEGLLNQPAFLYVLWIDTAGDVTPLHGWQGGTWQPQPAARESERLLLPGWDETSGAHRSYPLEGPAGTETAVLLARREPLTEDLGPLFTEDLRDAFRRVLKRPPADPRCPYEFTCRYEEALALRRELAVLRPEVYRPQVAMTLNNLGTAQSDLNDLEAARASHKEALAVRRELARLRPEVYRPQVAMTLNNLGTAQGALNDLEAARASFEEAANLQSVDAAQRPTAQLVERRTTWNNLGRLYLSESPALGWPDPQAARGAFRRARDCVEAFRGRFRDPAHRRRVQGEGLHVYESLTLANVDLWLLHADRDALHEAVGVAEASRARNLMELLAEEVLNPQNAPFGLAEEFRALRRRLRRARQSLEAAEDTPAAEDTRAEASAATAATRQATRKPGGTTAPAPAQPACPPDPPRREFEDAQRQYQEALRRIQAEHDPEFDPDRPVPPVTFEQARALLPADLPTAFVQFCLTEQRGLALVVLAGDAFAVTLPDLNARQGWELAIAWYESYYGGDRAAWEAALPELLRPVAERAVRPVAAALAGRGIRRLVLSPSKGLHVFPLHACPLADGTPLADAFAEVSYTPSLSILHRCAGRARPRPTRLAPVENPTADLPFTEVEGAGLRRLYADHVARRRGQATREAVLADAAGSHVFHDSGHAGFDPTDPLRSALLLGGKHESQRGQWLTLRDVFTQMNLRQNALTVVNGCESGMVRPDRVDEYVGLASGFLYAGATCVLSTLWAVYDLSSALLSLRFHREWLAGRAPGAALAAAQRWLRDIPSGVALRDEVLPGLLALLETDEQRAACAEAAGRYAASCPGRPPFASPAHWAPYTANGLTYPRPAAPPAPPAAGTGPGVRTRS